jgi:hypothetical protein
MYVSWNGNMMNRREESKIPHTGALHEPQANQARPFDTDRDKCAAATPKG